MSNTGDALCRNLSREACHHQEVPPSTPETVLLSHSTLHPQSLNIIPIGKGKTFPGPGFVHKAGQCLNLELIANKSVASTVSYSGPILSSSVFTV